MTILCGDCLNEMRKMEPNSIDFIVCDPPYGLKFMSKKWDYQVPSVEIWKEALRVLKPGGMAAIFGGSRTYHRMTVNVEDSGFEIRDCIMWLYGSGFPKSHNHFGLEGYGTALKPAYEPIILAMKPLDGTFAHNAEKWGLAGINILSSRIQHNEECKMMKKQDSINSMIQQSGRFEHVLELKPEGRWPANIIFDEEASHLLDQQSGVLTSGKANIGFTQNKDEFFKGKKNKICSNFSDSGVASRFFYCAKASTSERNAGLEGMPLKEKKTLNEYVNPSKCRTASKSGASSQNHHPTVKPLSLMRYIIKLLAPPGTPLLLDPFCGSGSTCVAAESLGIRSVGIDLSEEYCHIARKRIEHQKQSPKQMDLFDGKT